MAKQEKIYSSYAEIERDLEILKIERQLAYHRIRLSIEDLKDNFTVANLADEVVEMVQENMPSARKLLFRAALPFLLKRIFRGFFR